MNTTMTRNNAPPLPPSSSTRSFQISSLLTYLHSPSFFMPLHDQTCGFSHIAELLAWEEGLHLAKRIQLRV